MLQRARRMKGDPLRTMVHRHQRREAFPLVRDHFDRIAGELTYSLCLVGVFRIVAQQMSVVLDGHAAPARGDDDRLGALLDVRPPGVDVPARESSCFLVRAEMLADRAAAPGLRGEDQRNTHSIERTRQRRIDIRRQNRLHAAGEREHFPRVARLRPGFHRAHQRHLGRERRRQDWTRHPSHAEREGKQRAMTQALAQQPAPYAFAGRPPHSLVDQPAPDLDQPAVAHAGGTHGFAVAAGQATVQMQLRLGGNVRSFEQLLDQINAPARTVELVAQQLVSRTRRRAETAMNAGAQNRVRVASIRGVPDEIGQMRFHAQNSAYMRRRLKMPTGSSAVLSR